MIFRFSLYGFLKNQQYYEPFLILFFRQRGFSFLEIGWLIAFREITINLLEIPSGAVADLYGRRRAMILCFSAFIASFAVFAVGRAYGTFFAAMFLFGMGDAFRTGTHKAIILHWLELEGRTDEKTRVYGVTRSWAQAGSALSVLIAAALVFYTGDYRHIFWFCILPYAAGLVNFLGYPRELEGSHAGKVTVAETFRVTWGAFRQTMRRGRLRRLLAESLGFQGTYKVVKDYLQPILKSLAATAAGLSLFGGIEDPTRRVAIVVGVVYFGLYLLNMIASRQAHRAEALAGDEDRAARMIWGVAALVFLALAAATSMNCAVCATVVFILLAMIQNFWRPIQVGRIGSAADPATTATVLSVEMQCVSGFAALLAPLLGWLVDMVRAGDTATADVLPYLPVAVFGLVVALAFRLAPPPPRADGGESADCADAAD